MADQSELVQIDNVERPATPAEVAHIDAIRAGHQGDIPGE